MSAPFNYETAFSRNLGWTTEWEQDALRAKRVAIAGLGGVGGSHLLTLARTGIGAFNLADFDTFDLANFNRQAGANTGSVGRPKLDVLAEMALGINPELRLRRFPQGVTPDTVDAFLQGCDLFVDGLDFFALEIRAAVFARAAELGIPAITAAPIGMGVGFLAFRPGGQTFEQYFRLAGQPAQEQYLRFLMGVAPQGLHRAYLVDETRVDLEGKRGPSTAAACELCAGMVATQALKLLLNRGGVPFAPVHLTFDAYRCTLARTRLRWGANGPLQRLKRGVARRIYGKMAARTPATFPPAPQTPLQSILAAARWAPSGDNSQPWTFEPAGPLAVTVRLLREPGNTYEYRDGEPVLLAGGMLLESLAIAASSHAMRMDWSVSPADAWQLDVRFVPDPGMEPSPLAAALPVRSVVRHGMGARRLTGPEKQALSAALGPSLEATWFETPAERRSVARLGAMATDIRLRTRETFAVHGRVVDWDRRRSPDRVPARAIGLNRPTLTLMRWGMRSWDRMHRMNRLLGTSAAALQLDHWPAFRSAAMFAIRLVPQNDGPTEAPTPDATLRHGMALQRFWLTATRLGLGLQPALATLIFADYGWNRVPFTADDTLLDKAQALGEAFETQLGPVEAFIFLGRVGRLSPGLPGPRSTRRNLADVGTGAPPGNPTL